MGGPGSGMWYRWKQKKTTLDDVYCLDVRWLHRHGYVRPALRVYVRGAGRGRAMQTAWHQVSPWRRGTTRSGGWA